MASDPQSPTDITQILREWGSGDSEALDRLLPLIYDQLKRLARSRLKGEDRGHTLNTTALVHEAYLKMVGINSVNWQDRRHFFALASRIMRRVLVEFARHRNAKKRGGDLRPAEWIDDLMIPDDQVETILELDEALQKMEELCPRQCKAVEHHYFGGMTLQETGDLLGVSAPTVMRDLRFAIAWLAREWNQERG